MTEKSAKPLRDSSDQVIGWCSSLVVAPLKHTLLSWERCFASIGVEMELRHLRYFVAVAEAGSLTVAAARKLHTSQPSLSRQIRDLEDEVGAQLLKRGARGIELTPAGRAFLQHPPRVLLQVGGAPHTPPPGASPPHPPLPLCLLAGTQ